MMYAAFLLGINVGGNRKVPMADLKKLMEKLGFEEVKTLLASGNVRFEASGKPDAIATKIEAALKKEFGFDVGVIVRSLDDLGKLKKANPFKGIKVTKDTRLYITFLSEKPKSTIKTYVSPDKQFKILKVSPTEVTSMITVSEKMGTVDAMKILTKEFGKKITTRNWNTIEKLLT